MNANMNEKKNCSKCVKEIIHYIQGIQNGWDAMLNNDISKNNNKKYTKKMFNDQRLGMITLQKIIKIIKENGCVNG